jgi:hypothetical protein
MAAGIYLLVFLIGFIADFLSVQYQKAVEQNKIARTAAISMALEAIGWAGLITYVRTENMAIAVVSILASGAGATAGLFRVARQKRDAIECATVTTCPACCAPPLKNALGAECPPTEPGRVPRLIDRVEKPQT